MSITRRQFLSRSAAMAAGTALGPHLQWIPGTNTSYAAGPGDAIVVVVQLEGGNDGLNTVYPLTGSERSTYETIRPTLQNPDTVGGLSKWASAGFDATQILDVGQDAGLTNYALHPSMKAWHDIYQAGELAIVPGVHYPHADYSHFRSENIYFSGDPLGAGGFGWFGKYLNYEGFLPTQVPGVMIGGDYNPMFTPTDTSLFAFTSLSNLTFPAGSLADEREAAFRALYEQSAMADAGLLPELRSLGDTGVATVDTIKEYYLSGNGFENAGRVEALMIDAEEGRYNSNNSLVYDSPLNPENNSRLQDVRLARDLRHVAATIRADVGARFFHVRIGGFDSHSNQENGFFHSFLLNFVSEAVGAFWADMNQSVSLGGEYVGYETGSLASKVLIITQSEFGRTNAQNASDANSAGTDHATSAPQFVIGSTVNAGVIGEYPSLDDPAQDEDDLAMTHDLRDFYGTMLERWLNMPAVDIGPGPGKVFAETTTPDEFGNDYVAYTPIPYLPA